MASGIRIPSLVVAVWLFCTVAWPLDNIYIRAFMSLRAYESDVGGLGVGMSTLR